MIYRRLGALALLTALGMLGSAPPVNSQDVKCTSSLQGASLVCGAEGTFSNYSCKGAPRDW